MKLGYVGGKVAWGLRFFRPRASTETRTMFTRCSAGRRNLPSGAQRLALHFLFAASSNTECSLGLSPVIQLRPQILNFPKT